MPNTKKQKHPDIATKPVKSSQIAEIGHHGDTLCVKFHSGGCYHYHGVSSAQFDALQGAESVGKALGAIKSCCKFTKIGEENK